VQIRPIGARGFGLNLEHNEANTQGEKMLKSMFQTGYRALLSVGLAMALAVTLSAACLAQEKAPTQTAGVDNTKMGPYRALAQLSYQAFQKGDNAAAAELARILERTWDRGEGDLSKSNHDVWEQIDGSMDEFIKPVLHYAAKTPDPAAVGAAYNKYLEKLKLAD
jgi:hypothetical protein